MHFISDVVERNNPGLEMTPDKWNETVENFDTAKLAKQLHELDAGYFFLTIGQNSGYFCCPNKTYDNMTRSNPGKCSSRDLVSDLYDALEPYGIPVMVYLPSGGPKRDLDAEAAMEYIDPYSNPGKRNPEFQRNWESVIRDWSLRWGKKVSGWWIDGCYFADTMYRFKDAPNFKSFADAMRAGNPDSVVAWNPGVLYPPVTMDEEEDYTAGEINGDVNKCDDLEKAICIGSHERHELFHLLAPLGNGWARGQSRRNPARLFEETSSVTDFGGAVTWDIPFENDGSIPDDIFAVLLPFSKKINATRGKPVKPEIMQPRTTLKVLRYPSLQLDGRSVDGEAEIQLCNTRRTLISGTLNIESGGPVFPELAALEYKLAPDETTVVNIVLKVKGAEKTPSVFQFPAAPDMTIPVRRQFVIAECRENRLAGACEFDLKSSDGKIYAKLRVGICGENVAVWSQIMDRNIKICEGGYWQGSCLELFFAGDDRLSASFSCSSQSQIKQYFAIPAYEKNDASIFYLDNEYKKLEGASCSSITKEGFYELSCMIPLAKIFGEKNTNIKSFLFEAIATIPCENANVRASISGEPSAIKTVANYCELVRRWKEGI